MHPSFGLRLSRVSSIIFLNLALGILLVSISDSLELLVIYHSSIFQIFLYVFSRHNNLLVSSTRALVRADIGKDSDKKSK